MDKDKKICYVLGIYPNLSETFVHREINYFLSQGYDVSVYSLKVPSSKIAEMCKIDQRVKIKYFQKTILASFLKNFINLFRFTKGYISGLYLILKDFLSQTPYETFRLFALFIASSGLLSYVKKNKIKFVHSHFANASLMCLFANHMDKSFEYTFTLHASPDIYMRPLLLSEQLFNAKKIITISDYNYFLLRRYFYNELEEKLAIVRNGIEINEFRYKKADNSKIKLLAVGNFRYFKGFDVLIEAVELVKEANKYFELTIVGDGPQINSILKMVKSKKLVSIVNMVGAQSHESTLEYFKKSDVFIHASVIDVGGRRDGFPTVILEAISHSLPVISTYVSAIPELIINNETGILVPEGNPKELAKAILAMVSDADKRELFARKAYKRLVEYYDINKTTQRLEKIIIE